MGSEALSGSCLDHSWTVGAVLRLARGLKGGAQAQATALGCSSQRGLLVGRRVPCVAIRVGRFEPPAGLPWHRKDRSHARPTARAGREDLGCPARTVRSAVDDKATHYARSVHLHRVCADWLHLAPHPVWAAWDMTARTLTSDMDTHIPEWEFCLRWAILGFNLLDVALAGAARPPRTVSGLRLRPRDDTGYSAAP